MDFVTNKTCTTSPPATYSGRRQTQKRTLGRIRLQGPPKVAEGWAPDDQDLPIDPQVALQEDIYEI
ncbi:hypothetical protein N7532_009269 [Penicillium argentinense]|uniref:Uncharacterized protein n=1 Tax=Penicillium argentinense TaxID=1131581 RepID=A0A9W9K2P5_9EURO|nr:uncharacterized protein N7532_009269 [Penicillium argentinense]KAJ5090585.1 hypothetical protein N7532_009269 [Penicillium argentinense]